LRSAEEGTKGSLRASQNSVLYLTVTKAFIIYCFSSQCFIVPLYIGQLRNIAALPPPTSSAAVGPRCGYIPVQGALRPDLAI